MIAWIVGAAAGLVAIYKIVSTTTRTNKLPPGPPTLPVVGNLHQFPLKDFHVQFQKWADEYGSLVCLKTGSQNFMLLNEPSVVKDLIEKRSSNYSARPDWFIRNFNGNMNIAFRDNDEVWRRMRKMYHLRLNLTVANKYIPYQIFDSMQLLNDLLDTPDDFSRHLQRYTTSVASTVLYGWRTPSADRGYVKDLISWMDMMSAAANLQLADFYRFLRPIYAFIPTALSGYKQKLAEIKILEDRLFFSLKDDAKAKIASGKVYPSFIRDMLLSKDSDRLSEHEIAHQAAHGFGAGSDTQWNTLLAFVKAMILYPETQLEAQREIDAVIGPDRLPTWEDRVNLPYTRGIIEETLRWMPTTLSAAVPHSNTEADTYKDYNIPKGSTMMMNVWALNNSLAPVSPRTFDPTRHTAAKTSIETYGIDADSTKRAHFTFGAGRRVCPGYHVAARGLFVAVSRLLWAYNFERARDERGELIHIDQDAVTEGLIVRPVDFPCVITPRDEKKVAFIRKVWADAQSSLDSEGNFSEEYFSKVFLRSDSKIAA